MRFEAQWDRFTDKIVEKIRGLDSLSGIFFSGRGLRRDAPQCGVGWLLVDREANWSLGGGLTGGVVGTERYHRGMEEAGGMSQRAHLNVVVVAVAAVDCGVLIKHT